MRKLNARVLGVLVVAASVATPLAMRVDSANATSIRPFDYDISATTTLKTLNQTITINHGEFKGGINFGTGNVDAPLSGSITLPPATFTYEPLSPLGVPLGVVTATAKIIPTKKVSGFVDLSTLTVTATAVFNIRITNAHLTGTTTNLVGNNCVTATPVSVTMSGQASFSGPQTFSGTFTLPKLKNCGLGTTALNLVLPGPGNTFTALATPKS